jgi:hypothetical protein
MGVNCLVVAEKVPPANYVVKAARNGTDKGLMVEKLEEKTNVEITSGTGSHDNGGGHA